MKKLSIIFLLITGFVFSCFSQNYYIVKGIVTGSDTMPLIVLPKFTVEGKMPAKLKRKYRRNQRLIYNIRKVMPYAKIAARELYNAEMELAGVTDEKVRKQYFKNKEKELRERFEDDLYRMTYSQGKLLIKLIDREINKTAYNIIKEYRSGFTAVFWQTFSSIFGYNLKTGYDPEGKDKEIEEIIQMLGYD